MSRSMAPSPSQMEKLVDLLNNRRFLVTGYARTAHARDRSRAAWQEIANVLNSEGNGCIKTWQQWAKYWKDKKAALKKKVSQINQARRHTSGGAAEEVLHLTSLEEQLLALVGGEDFAIGDRELEINPFENPPAEPEPLPPSPAVASNSPPILLIIKDEQPNNSDSILQGLSFPAESMVVQGGSEMMNEAHQTVQATPEPQAGPSSTASTFLSPQIIKLNHEATETVGRQAVSAASSPRRRRVAHARRRLLQRLQRNSQMASLTERLIAIEERRVDLEMMQGRSREAMAQSLERISYGFLQQSQAIQSLAEALKFFLEYN